MKKKSNSSEECESLETSVNAMDEKGCLRRVMKRERKPRNMHSLSSGSEKHPSPAKKPKDKSTSSGKEQKRRGRPSLTPGATSNNKSNTEPSSSGGKRRGRPSLRTQRTESSLQGSIRSVSISGRTTTESVLSTKAMASTGEDAEPIYIEDEDDTKGATSILSETRPYSSPPSSTSSSRSNLVIDMSPTTSTTEQPAKTLKRTRSKSLSNEVIDTKTIDDVIESVVAGNPSNPSVHITLYI